MIPAMRRNAFDDLARELGELAATSIQTVVVDAEQIAVRQARAAGFANIFGNGLSTRPIDLTTTPTSATVTIAGVPAGPWSWAESGTAPHWIRPRRRKAMTLPRHPMSKAVRSPGMAGRGAWTATLDEIETDVADVIGHALAAI